MLFSTIGQIYIFLFMTGAGVLVGALYSLTAGLRCLLRAGFWLTLLIDALFGLAAACLLIAALLACCYGQARLYQFLGVFIGAALFLQGVFPLLCRACTWFEKKLRHIFAHIREYRLIKVIFK